MAKHFNAKRPLVSLLSTEFIERIIKEAKDVLEKTGVWVQNEEGLELLGNGGAQIDRGKSKAFIPRRLVEESLKSVPSSVKIYDRNGNLCVNLEGNNSYFEPGSAGIKVLDSDLNVIREPITQDHINYVKLVDALDNIDQLSAAIIPTDIPKGLMPKDTGIREGMIFELREKTT